MYRKDSNTDGIMMTSVQPRRIWGVVTILYECPEMKTKTRGSRKKKDRSRVLSYPVVTLVCGGGGSDGCGGGDNVRIGVGDGGGVGSGENGVGGGLRDGDRVFWV